jgi:hypothetical protein
MAAPIITGQIVNPIILGENKILTVRLTDLIVDDPDYPDGSGKDWSIEAHSGAHYTIDTDSGEVTYLYVIPTTSYKGNLSVQVRVNNGIDYSNWYILNVTVVEIPIIVNQTSFPKMYVGSYFAITLNNLNVQTSKPYPGNFKLLASSGTKYEISSVTDTTVKIKVLGDVSDISRQIALQVSDGVIWSDNYNYIVNVVAAPKGSKPQSYNINIPTASPFRRTF